MTLKQAIIELEADTQVCEDFGNFEDEIAVNEIAIAAIQKQIPKPPIPDKNATDRFGKPVPRCQVCGYALDLQIEQYCPNCGQRLTEYGEVVTKSGEVEETE